MSQRDLDNNNALVPWKAKQDFTQYYSQTESYMHFHAYIPLSVASHGKHRCAARHFNKYTRLQWWYQQQAKAEAERERNRQRQQHLLQTFHSEQRHFNF